MGRKTCCERVGLKRGRWTAEEDAKLTEYIQVNGEGCWATLAKYAGLLRCGKSCRLRWMNYLRPDLEKRRFSTEEDDLIIHLHASLGSRWSLIARHLSGRTDNGIKNYWNSHLSRKIHPHWRSVLSDRGRVSAMNVPKLDLPPEQQHERKRSSVKKKQSRVQKRNILVSDEMTAKNGEVCPETTMREKEVEAEARRNILASDEMTAAPVDGVFGFSEVREEIVDGSAWGCGGERESGGGCTWPETAEEWDLLQGIGREKDEILTWLLDGDEFERTNVEHESESESEKLDAMFAWLLS